MGEGRKLPVKLALRNDSYWPVEEMYRLRLGQNEEWRALICRVSYH
jgi:hypothetical protein